MIQTAAIVEFTCIKLLATIKSSSITIEIACNILRFIITYSFPICLTTGMCLFYHVGIKSVNFIKRQEILIISDRRRGTKIILL